MLYTVGLTLIFNDQRCSRRASDITLQTLRMSLAGLPRLVRPSPVKLFPYAISSSRAFARYCCLKHEQVQRSNCPSSPRRYRKRSSFRNHMCTGRWSEYDDLPGIEAYRSATETLEECWSIFSQRSLISRGVERETHSIIA